MGLQHTCDQCDNVIPGYTPSRNLCWIGSRSADLCGTCIGTACELIFGDEPLGTVHPRPEPAWLRFLRTLRFFGLT